MNIIQGSPQPQKDQYKVYVRSLTYNQTAYIVDCLNGVAIQQTGFPFVHCVYDDHSTDGAPVVIKQWLNDNCKMNTANWFDNELAEVVEVKHKTNANLTVVVYFFKRNLHHEKDAKYAQFATWQKVCEYETVCEGDDHWIDEYKLQKQVDYLDKNADYGLVFTDYNVIDTNNEILRDNKIPELYRKMKKDVRDGLIFPSLFSKPSCIITCTILYRTCYNKVFLIDHDKIMWISCNSKVKYLPEICANYRINPMGMMRSQAEKVNQLLFKTMTKYMLLFYKGEIEYRLYKREEIRTAVRNFFAIYCVAWLKGNNNSNFNTICFCIKRDPIILISTPFFTIKRIL